VSRTSYVFTQRLGAYLRDEGSAGLMVRSARCDGTNAAVLTPTVLSNVRDRCFLTYRCSPAEDAVSVLRQDRIVLRVTPSTLY
jgi:hypothetical protein